MLFIKTHETVNCNSTLRQLFIFFFLCWTSAMLRYLKLDTGGLAVAAAWLAFHHLFFLGLMGCGESFCLAVAQLLLSMQNQALFSLLCFCYAQLCHDWVGCCSFFGILGLHFCWVYCRLSWLLCWSFCLRKSGLAQLLGIVVVVVVMVWKKLFYKKYF